MSATKDQRPRGGARKPRPRNETANQALERALDHASLAISEGIASARAILDAASIVVSGLPADSQPNLAELARTLDQLTAALSGESPSLRATAINTLLGAIDAEISRWEIRSQSDEDARAVLRVFMGLREVLWELGFRRSTQQDTKQRTSDTAAASAQAGETGWASKELGRPGSNHAGAQTQATPPARKSPTRRGTSPGGRVQRIKIEG